MFLCQAVTGKTSDTSSPFSFGHHTTTTCIVLHEITIVSSCQRRLAGWPRDISTTRSGPIRSDRKPFEKPTFALFWEWQQVNSTSASCFLPIRAKKQMLPGTRNETSFLGLFSDLAHGLLSHHCGAEIRSSHFPKPKNSPSLFRLFLEWREPRDQWSKTQDKRSNSAQSYCSSHQKKKKKWIKLIPKTIGNRKRDCAWGGSGWYTSVLCERLKQQCLYSGPLWPNWLDRSFSSCIRQLADRSGGKSEDSWASDPGSSSLCGEVFVTSLFFFSKLRT